MINKIIDDADKMEENLQKKLDGLYELHYSIIILNRHNADIINPTYNAHIDACS